MQVTKAKLCTIFIAAMLLAVSYGCAPTYKPGGDPSESGGVPELSDEVIGERINDTRVYDVPPESGAGDTINWGFDEDEPKEITVVDKQIDGARATIVLDIKTRSAMRANIHRELAGQIRTEWALETGVVLRRWEIKKTENISMTYKDLPKPSPTPSPQNPNR